MLKPIYARARFVVIAAVMVATMILISPAMAMNTPEAAFHTAQETESYAYYMDGLMFELPVGWAIDEDDQSGGTLIFANSQKALEADTLESGDVGGIIQIFPDALFSDQLEMPGDVLDLYLAQMGSTGAEIAETDFKGFNAAQTETFIDFNDGQYYIYAIVVRVGENHVMLLFLSRSEEDAALMKRIADSFEFDADALNAGVNDALQLGEEGTAVPEETAVPAETEAPAPDNEEELMPPSGHANDSYVYALPEGWAVWKDLADEGIVIISDDLDTLNVLMNGEKITSGIVGSIQVRVNTETDTLDPVNALSTELGSLGMSEPPIITETTFNGYPGAWYSGEYKEEQFSGFAYAAFYVMEDVTVYAIFVSVDNDANQRELFERIVTSIEVDPEAFKEFIEPLE